MLVRMLSDVSVGRGVADAGNVEVAIALGDDEIDGDGVANGRSVAVSVN